MRIKFIQKTIDKIRGKNKFWYQKRIDNAKILHIMFNDKFNKPFVDFLNKNFDNKEHLILCHRMFNNVATPFPEGDNVIEIKNITKIDLSSPKIEKIICHSLFMGDLVDKLYNEPELLKKSYWVIWGGDLYGASRDAKNDFIRKNFKSYVTDVDGDDIFAKKTYHSNPLVFNAGYTFPITIDMIKKAKERQNKKDYIKIQINNSADETTLEMLDILAKFKDKNIKVTTILSYGQMDFKNQIIAKGTEFFGDNFEPLLEIMNPDQYTYYLKDNDVLILNQNRQQGLGNSFANLALGAKLFIKSNVTTYSFLNNNNIVVYDTLNINSFNFNDFVRYEDKVKNNNIKNSLKFFDDSYLKNLWDPIFESEN